MKKKFFGFLSAVLAFVVLGGTAFVAADENLQKTDSAYAGDVPATLYLSPNANWKVDNARFAAYFFGNGDTWVSMTDTDQDGIYEVSTPSGYPSVIFCRMNPGATANNWNNKWNQTGDLTIPTDGRDLYTIPSGSWNGSDNTNWSFKNAPTIEITSANGDVVDVEGTIQLTATTKNTSSTTISWTSSNPNVATVGATGKVTEVTGKSYGSVNITATLTDGGKSYSSSFSLSVVHYLEGGEKFYLTPSSEWKQAEAWFAMYMWGNNGNTWAKFSLFDSDNNIYIAEVPTGAWHGFKFVRMNPASEELSWDNKWSETGNAAFDGVNNHYTISGWDKFETSAYSPNSNGITGDLYILDDGNWTEDNAALAAYIWSYYGDANAKWIKLSAIDGSDFYKLTIPAEYTYGVKVIIARYDGSKEPSWENESIYNRTENIEASETQGANVVEANGYKTEKDEQERSYLAIKFDSALDYDGLKNYTQTYFHDACVTSEDDQVQQTMTEELWDKAAEEFAKLSEMQKTLFKTAKSDENGSTIQDALAIYSHLVVSRGFADFADIVDDSLETINGFMSGKDNYLSIIIIVCAGILATSALLLYRKRKVQ